MAKKKRKTHTHTHTSVHKLLGLLPAELGGRNRARLLLVDLLSSAVFLHTIRALEYIGSHGYVLEEKKSYAFECLALDTDIKKTLSGIKIVWGLVVYKNRPHIVLGFQAWWSKLNSLLKKRSNFAVPTSKTLQKHFGGKRPCLS